MYGSSTHVEQEKGCPYPVLATPQLRCSSFQTCSCWSTATMRIVRPMPFFSFLKTRKTHRLEDATYRSQTAKLPHRSSSWRSVLLLKVRGICIAQSSNPFGRSVLKGVTIPQHQLSYTYGQIWRKHALDTLSSLLGSGFWTLWKAVAGSQWHLGGSVFGVEVIFCPGFW